MYIRLFAAARQLAAAETIEVEVGQPLTLSELQKLVIAKYPALEKIVLQSRWAVNSEYALMSDPIPGDAEVALIPPVSGG